MGKLHRITGSLDPDRLVRAFEIVVLHSDALRTVVADEPGQPAFARVLTTPPATTEILDLPAAALADWCADRIATPLDATVCGYDSVLLRHGEDDWTWWLDLHHVVTDAVASALVFERTGATYAALSGGDDPDDGVADLVSFYDHVEASEARHADGRDERSAFWTSRATNDAPPTPYGPHGPRTTRTSRDLISPVGELGTALDGPYRTLSRELTLLGLASVATASLLSRLDGRSVITLGLPIHHRSGREAGRVIGPLMELYPLRVEVDPTETFATAFRRVLRDVIDVLRRAKPGEGPDARFDAVVNVLTARFGDFAGLPTETSWARADHVDPAHPIGVVVYDYGDGLRLELDVNDGLSRDGSHRRMAAHLGAVLDAAIADPDRRVADVEVVTADELTILTALNPASPDGPALRPVHEVVAEQLRSAPDHVTAECRSIELTSGSLDALSDALAVWLHGQDIGRGDRVGLRMERSLDTLVAMHGVLRSGAAFVFLDPADPDARHDAIVADAALRIVLDGLPDLDAATSPPPVEVGLDDLAYVLYTSGSTGTPKGVPISHRGLADYLRFATQAYRTAAPPVMALHSSLVFDLTITSLFLPQLTGGRTVVVPGDPLAALADVAGRTDLTVLKATPSQLELLTRMIDEPLGLEVVVVGGEAFRRPVAAAFVERCRSGVRVFNEYGPTEAVVGCMIHEWEPSTDLGPDIPIGRASPGAEVYVIDHTGGRAPVGAWGELHVRRPGMADGYLNLPELSAERFARVPGFGEAPLYRTGDRVRVEGTVLVYGGREDDQLKVAGVRLEPGEIEAALVGHSAVTNAVVRMWSPAATTVRRCARCGLGTDVPDVLLDGAGVCSVCHHSDRIEPLTRAWFKLPEDLEHERLAARAATRADVDCLHLLSGGVDSTYALYQLVASGWRVHAFTLDHGYLSEDTRSSIARTVADLGVSHEFVTTGAMDAILRDSLDRDADVRNGCQQTLSTLATARARELGVPVIFDGSSRGSLVETRLLPHLFEQDPFDPDEIDRTALQARQVRHRTADTVTTLSPDQRVYDDLTVLDGIRTLDFYRYVDVELAEMRRFLEERAPWVRRSGGGRSSNRLVDAAGIHVHRLERGYHSHAERYGWDVRLGHTTRDEALVELDGEIDVGQVDRMLAEIGYRPRHTELLTAWYQTTDGRALDPALLRSHLRETLPARSIPAAFVHVHDLPLAESAKLDIGALPAPSRRHTGSLPYTAPSTPTQALAAEVWSSVLDVDRVGIDDDFFDLGGSSLPALEAIAAMEQSIGFDLPDALVFEHRTLRDFAAAVDALTRDGRAIAPIPSLPPDQRPLSPVEAALLFEHRSDPGATRYNVTWLCTVSEVLDLPRVRAVLTTVVARHPSLHTAFDVQRTVLAPEVACTVQPMPPGPVAGFADRQRRVPFDLDNGPLVRVHVGHGDGETHLLIGMHHLCVDAGTFDLFWKEFDAAWHGRTLPPLTTSVAEHGAWQRTRWDDAIDFWDRTAARDERAGDVVLPPPPLPEPDGYLEIDAPMPTSEIVDASVTTPFAAALAAAAAVLSAHSRSGDVELGVTVSTKDHPAVEPVIGYFLNTMPLLLHVDAATPLRQFDRQAGELVAAALSHRTLPLAEIVERSRRLGRRSPDVSHMLAYERHGLPTWGSDTAEHHSLGFSGTSVSDVTFFVHERNEQMRLGIEYRGTVIGREDAQRLLDAFATVIETICRFPHRTVGDAVAPLVGTDLTGPELVDSPSSALELFIERARDTPERTAVIDAHGAVTTYGELLERAGRLAASIESAVPDARRVGVSVPRSGAMVEAILAVQLAGAAYVPLDPGTPDHRLDLIVRVAQLDAVVVDDTTRHRHPGLPKILVGAARGGADPLVRVPDPGSDVYVIFTSGSTGEPAGVAVSHRNLAASTAARAVHYGDGPPERFLLTSSIGFDSSLVALTWPLATGGAVVIPGDDDVHDVDRLGAIIADRDVTHVLMVPSLYRALLDRRPERLRSLRTAIVAGEACPPSLAVVHHRLLSHVALVNEYGPTEATVWAAVHDVMVGDDPVPIGRPIAGVTLRIADDRQQPIGRGSPGELLIAGPGVTQGYLSGRSNDAFVETDGRRWYRTGDLVRADGLDRVLFLGRVDDQLNVGGLRIEPSEIERHLTELSSVSDALVVAAEVDGRPTIVAHLEGDPDLVDPRTARDHLADRIVAAAIPRRFVVHRALPRTIHGKIDRVAASHLPVDLPEAPGATTDRMVDIWRSVLGQPDLDHHADFFASGGDSLAAVEIVTRVGQLVGREIAVAALLDAPTPATMSTALHWSPRDGEQRPVRLLTLRTGQETGPLVLMTAAWDDVQGYRELADALPDDITVIATVVTDRSGAFDTVERVVDEIISDFPGLGRRERLAVVGWSIGGVVAFELGQRLARDGHPVSLIGLVDTYFPGEHQRLWSNRWWKYKSLLRPGALTAARREAAITLRRRAGRVAATVGRRLLTWAGEELPVAAASASVIPAAAMNHEPTPGRARVTLYAASTTNPDRTVVPWGRVAADLRVVTIEGRHRGHDSIMGRGRVDPIANDLAASLES
jgi:amino acid adenylation domain-containing protein